jgi:hypothetical protein
MWVWPNEEAVVCGKRSLAPPVLLYRGAISSVTMAITPDIFCYLHSGAHDQQECFSGVYNSNDKASILAGGFLGTSPVSSTPL